MSAEIDFQKLNDYEKVEEEAKHKMVQASSKMGFPALYRHLTSRSDLGDYFIAQIVSKVFSHHHKKVTRSGLNAALNNNSREFNSLPRNEKGEWLNEFLNIIDEK